MFALRSSLGYQQCRLFSKSLLRNDRFSRESLRNRIYKQNLKDLSRKQIADGPTGSSHATYVGDIIPVRPPRDLRRALAFTVGVGAGSFALAVVSDLERAKREATNFYKDAAEMFKASFTLKQSRPEDVKWSDLSHGDRNAVLLIAMNIAVFALWKVRSLQPVMWRYFTNSYASKSLCLPMLLSAFSHSSLIHLGLNMYVVYTFTNLAIDKFLGPDQFWAFYVTAAVVSSFTSLAHKAVVRSPIRALGASGAILGLLGYTCMKIPDSQLRIVFIPNFHFSAESAIIGIVLFDLAGLLFKFRLFDHAAHLGGTLFGIYYAVHGEKLLWDVYGGVVESIYRAISGDSNK